MTGRGRLPVRPTLTRSGPTKIGGVRPSHLITTNGVGAVADLPAMSVMVRSLDTWSPEAQQTIVEPRLLDEVRAVLGTQVRALRRAPWDEQDADSPYSRVGVPVTPFPRWLRCPRCHRLGPLDPPGQFALVHRYGNRPDLARYVHAQCQLQGNRPNSSRRACVPARFLVVCEGGHLDEFPYVDFIHRGSDEPCGGARLTMRDSASTLGPRVTLRCEECGASRNVQSAAGRDGSARLPRCRGRHPHLQRFEGCNRPVRLMVLGASNLWFGVTASALHLPVGESLRDHVIDHWEVLAAQPTMQILGLIVDGMDELRAMRGWPLEEIWATVEKVRAEGGPQPTEPADLLDAEWQLLCRPTTDKQDRDFRATPVASPPGFEKLIDQVVQVPRLREVRALLGFTRLAAPERREHDPQHRISLARSAPTWVPAVEQRGEGIFIQLDETLVANWEQRVDEHPRIEALRRAHTRWLYARSRPADPGFPVARYLLVHTLSHLLIRQVALECGYSSASLRERLYVERGTTPTAGVLLSTAASDTEGTLGGLVSLGRPDHLSRLLEDALRDAGRCSSDPLCAEHQPVDPDDTLHGAACHACAFASETTCEAGNRWLDRAVLVELPGVSDLAVPFR
jgi:hypothetical protein